MPKEAPLYDEIVKILLEKKEFDQAAARFRKFLNNYPDSSLADNAQYWLAESYYAKGDFKMADAEFAKLAMNYPKSDKRCGAMLKQSYSLEKLGNKERSLNVLKSVLKECPSSSEAKTASEKLKTTQTKVPKIGE